LITSATPAFIVLFAWWILHERASNRQWIGLGIATFGVLVVSLLDSQAATDEATNPLLGNLLLIVAAVTWALYSVLVKLNSQKYHCAGDHAGGDSLGHSHRRARGCDRVADPNDRDADLARDFGHPVYRHRLDGDRVLLWNKSFELLDAATASLFFFAQPVVGTLLSAIFRGEELGWSFFVGGALILLVHCWEC